MITHRLATLSALTTIIALTIPLEQINYLNIPLKPTNYFSQGVLAQTTPKYKQISQQKALTTLTTTVVYPGRVTTIDFSQTGEIITYINLGDSSKVVYNTDQPIESNLASTVFIKPIQTLRFPGATTTPITNLVIKTINPTSKQSYLYNFKIVHQRGTPSHLGIQITNKTTNTTLKTIQIGQGRTASINDIEIGLRYAIINGYTSADDPIVKKVRNFIAIVNNSPISISQAAQQAGVDLAVIVELGKISFERFASNEDNFF
ncbi:hypothetical protein PCC7424_5823 (plasmid) [Gloeothece citriformis PCC 7424]|uniref:Uncharacterized protein n=1 Tax=Gloeothece citriformis (strain PCC 7424) TaxID=65393 RepID=B7KM59_GLOC7|nr:hypothetical protein [Gloeothece citriformis]ACK73881.1 hypothetical protein PCC7424_5823 [Gloeothece citriformis PCC 7424]